MLERKQMEVEDLSKKFESKVRAREEEQYQLKQELAKLALTINMEAQKRRHHQSETQRCVVNDVAFVTTKTMDDCAHMCEL